VNSLKDLPQGHAFTAEVKLPEKRRLFLTHTRIEKSSFGAADWLGWEFVVSGVEESGETVPIADFWEIMLLSILRYASDYSEEPIEWCSQQTNQIVDLSKVQPNFDRSRYFDRCIKATYSSDGDQRVCFNQYDDGLYRFMREKRIEYQGLVAWEPQEWSKPHENIAAAEDEARSLLNW